MAPNNCLIAMDWVFKSLVELAANATIVQVLVNLKDWCCDVHPHAAVHVGGVQGQVVHLQHKLGQKEEFDLLKGSALAQEEVKDARGSNFMMWRHIQRWQRSFLFRAKELKEDRSICLSWTWDTKLKGQLNKPWTDHQHFLYKDVILSTSALYRHNWTYLQRR